MFENFSIRKFDFLLTFMVLALTLIGILAIRSAAPSLTDRQVMGLGIGILALIAAAVIDYRKLLDFYWGFYVFAVLMLVSVLLFGSTGGGARRWISLGGLTFQPSEAAKLLLILFYSALIIKLRRSVHWLLMPVVVLVLAIAPAFLVVKEPDLSTALVLMIIVCSLLFAGGLDYKVIFGAMAVLIPCAALFFFMVLQPGQTLLSTYQQSRILAWIHPEDYASTTAYQTIKSMTAIGSGRLMGKGYNTTTISSLLNTGFISQAQTDFIFAVIGEEFGFIGCCLVVLLLLGICVRCFSIASRARNLRGRILASGIGAWIGFQGFINICVTLGLLPNTGIPLPFVSYGLTSLVSLFAGIGCVLSVGMRG